VRGEAVGHQPRGVPGAERRQGCALPSCAISEIAPGSTRRRRSTAEAGSRSSSMRGASVAPAGAKSVGRSVPWTSTPARRARVIAGTSARSAIARLGRPK